MPKFLTFHSPSPRELKENPLKALWDSFQSLDQFTKGFLIVLLLILISTPFLVNNLLIFKPHAQETEPTLGEQTPPIPPSVPGEILIKFKAGVNEKVKENIRHAYGLKKEDEISQIGVERLKVPEKVKDKVIEALKHNPRVEFAEPNYIAQAQDIPNDPDYVASKQWALSKIAAPIAWDISKGSSSVIVAVIDSGVNSNHEEFVGKILPGYNYLTNTTDTSDTQNHGTEVSGIVGAITNNGKGIASLGRDISIMPLVIVTSFGTCSSYNGALAVTYAVDHGAKVINMSWGSSTLITTLQNAISYGWNKGVVFAAAAGNAGTSPLIYPASEPNVIAVGMTDSNDTKSFSNYGTGLDVMAPGVGIDTTINNGGYTSGSGTSFASPHVAALAALMMSANPSLTNQQVNDIITSTADKITSGCDVYDSNGWSQYCGYGRINAGAALQKAVGSTAPPPDTITPTASITSPTNGSTVSGVIDFTANASDNVGVTKVEFSYNCAGTNVALATDTTSPYIASWDTTKCPNGSSANLYVRAYDGAGNSNPVGSVSVVVTVNNTTPDTTPPAASITAPTNGSNVSGNVNIQASATDTVGVTTLSIFVDNSLVTTCSSGSCSYAWDTTQFASGSHTIQAQALDAAGNLGSSSIITVNVSNTLTTPTPTPLPSDTTPPSVSITNPLNGSIVKAASKVTIQASATDNIKISKVEFYTSSSSTAICTSTLSTGPYSCTWSVPGKKNTNYTITTKAYDSSNNVGAASVVVTAK